MVLSCNKAVYFHLFEKEDTYAHMIANFWQGKYAHMIANFWQGDKPYLRKSTDRKAQISPLNWTNAFLICAVRSVDFLR